MLSHLRMCVPRIRYPVHAGDYTASASMEHERNARGSSVLVPFGRCRQSMGWILPLSPFHERELRRGLLQDAAESRHGRHMAVPEFRWLICRWKICKKEKKNVRQIYVILHNDFWRKQVSRLIDSRIDVHWLMLFSKSDLREPVGSRGFQKSINADPDDGGPISWSHTRFFFLGAIPMMAAAVHCLADNVWYCCIFIYCSLSMWGLLKVIYRFLLLTLIRRHSVARRVY